MRIQVIVGLGLISSLVFVGCAADPASDQDLSWEEFRATVYQEPDTGIYVVNGDEIVETEAELRSFYDGLMAERASAGLAEEGLGRAEQPLIVNRVGGKDDRWSSATAGNLTYCVSKSSFGTRYNAVVSAMTAATGAWEGTATVNFVHNSAQDGNCTRSTSNVVFNVRQVSGGQFLARAFFPSSSRSAREVLIDSTSFGNISPYTLNGILRHELGHSIGFRHEHTRPESGTCFEDNNWRALSTYDAASVMHYPQCNGSNNGDLSLTSKDKSGARALYP